MASQQCCSKIAGNVADFDSESDYIKLEIGDKEGRKWISNNTSLHDNIPVQLNPNVLEHWRMERSQNEPLWSFHVISSIDQKKMYVTYCNNSDNVTLEQEDDVTNDVRNRFFSIYVTPNHGILMRDNNQRDRYLINQDGKLEMLTTEIPTEDMEWLMAPSFDSTDALVSSFHVEIRHLYSSIKWVSSEPDEYNSITAQQTSATQEWVMTRNADLLLHFSSGNLHATQALQFGKRPGTFQAHYKHDGMRLYVGERGYVAAPSDSGDLYITDKQSATLWDLQVVRLRFTYEHETVLFPMIPIPSTRTTE